MSTESDDLRFMRQALDLAACGCGYVEPNPMVGCVIVSGGKTIAMGYHHEFGGPHAERDALAECDQSPAGATAYVNLEPCCAMKRKKTPPCVPALIEARLARVVVGCLDPNPHVAGHGVQMLRDAGIRVDVGVLGPQCQQLNAPFFAHMAHRRPYVTLKWAQSADNKVAGPGGARVTLSNEQSLRTTHELRARCDSILVGVGTVLADDPLLTVRGVKPMRNVCLRVVLDRDLRTPRHCRLIATADQQPVCIFTATSTMETRPTLVQWFRSQGVSILPLDPDRSGLLPLLPALTEINRTGFTHLLVEGGPTVHASFIRSDLADRAWVYHSPRRIDAPDAPDAARITYPIVGKVDIAGDRLCEHLNPHSDVYFAPAFSPDFEQITADYASPSPT